MNKLFEWFGQPFEQMSKTDNVEQTGRLFERMKILLICTTGSIPSAWLDQGMGNVVVYFFHFICCCSQFQGLYSHDQKWRLFQFVIEITFIVIVLNY